MLRLRLPLLLVAFVGLGLPPAHAQPTVPPAKPYEAAVKQLETFIVREMAEKGLPALSIVLVLEQAYPGGPGGWEFRKNSKSFGVFRGFKRCVDSSTPGPTRDFE